MREILIATHPVFLIHSVNLERTIPILTNRTLNLLWKRASTQGTQITRVHPTSFRLPKKKKYYFIRAYFGFISGTVPIEVLTHNL